MLLTFAEIENDPLLVIRDYCVPSVKSFNFDGMKFHGFGTKDNFNGTIIRGFCISVITYVCCGSSDHVSEELLDRIKALEDKDTVQSLRLEQLELQSTSYNAEIQKLHEANIVLQHDIAMITMENNGKDGRISKLEKKIEDLITNSNTDKTIIGTLNSMITTLQEKENEFERKISDMDTILVSHRHQIQAKLEQDLTRKNEDDGQLNVNTTYGEVRGSSKMMTYFNDILGKSRKMNDCLNKPKKEQTKSSQTDFKNKDRFSQVMKSMGSKHHQVKKGTLTDTPVAFHAVLTTHIVRHLGTHEAIKFDAILINLGDGYENQHGVFSAPKTGMYLFSVSVAVPEDSYFVADILKDGSKVAGVLGGSSLTYGQGSVTFVTQMNAGNEIWVQHTGPVHMPIWGNYYSSFSGVLLF